MRTVPNLEVPRDDSFNPGTAWIQALRQSNAQYQAGITGVARIEMRLFKEACTLALLRRLLPNLRPELLQHLAIPAP